MALTSSHAAVPSRMPTSRSPTFVSSTTVPRTTSPTRTSPLADLATTLARDSSTAISPLAALRRRSPPATPTHVSPLEFLITALSPSSRTRTSPDPTVTSAWPLACSTLMSPAPLFRLSVSTWSIRMCPSPVLSRQSPSRPSQSKPASCAAPCTLEPAGSSTVTSIDPPALRMDQERSFGALISNCWSAHSTRVSSAALRSSRLDASLGCTSTTVASRSPARIRTSPMTRSIVAEIGSGVAKVGIGMFS